MRILVTGIAGFIGHHVARRLIARGDTVIGLDSVNSYYDPSLKEARLALLEGTARQSNAGYVFLKGDLADRETVDACFRENRPEQVIHLAAQAGVRHSLENPVAYVESNLLGFTHVLEACRHQDVGHLTYASTSSVYGANTRMPFSEHDGVDHPLQFYAATKRANELMAHAYSHLFGLPTTGLRFFTVYGPWGRPDMALFRFTESILQDRPVTIFNHGRHTRDFTYIDDVVEGIIRVNDSPAAPDPQWDPAHPDPASSSAPFRLYNIGNSAPVSLLDYVKAIEEALGKKARIEMLPLQPGDLADTCADVSELTRAMGYRPATPMREGVAKFVSWYREYYGC